MAAGVHAGRPVTGWFPGCGTVMVPVCPLLMRCRSYAAPGSRTGFRSGLLGDWPVIGSGGRLGGRTMSVHARECWPQLLAMRVRAAQGLYGVLVDWLVRDGKEKVYGSIP